MTLTTSTLSEDPIYTLTVDDVEDLADNAVAPDSRARFVYVQDPDGLVAYWPLDEGAGTTTLDASGHGHTGILVNGPRWIGGPSLEFDGQDDHVDVGTLEVIGGALTLAAWLYSYDLANCVARDCRIISKTTGTAESDHYFMLSTIESGADTRLRFRLKAGGTTTTLIASSGHLPENTWVHAAAVYDGGVEPDYLLDLVLGFPRGLTDPPSVVRFHGARFDPRRLVPSEPEARDALLSLAGQILTGGGGLWLLGAQSTELRSYDSPAAHRRELLSSLRLHGTSS